MMTACYFLNLMVFANLVFINNLTNLGLLFLVIILCKIDYDSDILQNEIFNNKINYLAKKIESDFIIQKKIDYNFKLYE